MRVVCAADERAARHGLRAIASHAALINQLPATETVAGREFYPIVNSRLSIVNHFLRRAAIRLRVTPAACLLRRDRDRRAPSVSGFAYAVTG